MVAHADQLVVEKARLSTLLAASQTNAGVSLPQEPSRELLRLRGEVGRLRLEERERLSSRAVIRCRPPKQSWQMPKLSLRAPKLLWGGTVSADGLTVNGTLHGPLKRPDGSLRLSAQPEYEGPQAEELNRSTPEREGGEGDQ